MFAKALQIDFFAIDQDAFSFDLYRTDTDLVFIFIDQLSVVFDRDLQRIQIGIADFPQMCLFDLQLSLSAFALSDAVSFLIE